MQLIKIYKVRTGGMFHGTTYIICAENKQEAINLIYIEENEKVADDDVEEATLDRSGIIASGDFHWMYSK